MRDLFRTKTMSSLMKEASTSESSGLKRVLGVPHLTALGVGAIVGAGIFVITGQAAAQYAGPGIVFSFLLSAVACGFAGLCYAEFASTIPVAGSAYTYAYATLGELVAWIIGWTLILEYLFSGAAVAVGWSGYLVSFLRDFGIFIPPQLTAATGTHLIQLPQTLIWTQATPALIQELISQGINVSALPQVQALFNLPAVSILLALTVLLVIGTKQSAFFNNIIVALKISTILLFIFFGFRYVNTDNWFPLIPANTGEFGHYGWSGVLRGAGVIFFSYIGFDAISTLAQESKNPQRDMPLSILGSLAICTVLYVTISLVLTGMVKYTHLLVPDPIALAVDTAGPTLFWLRPIVKLGAVAGLSSVILVMLLGQTRIFFAISKDGLIPPIFSKIHKSYRTPYISAIVTGGMASLFAATLSIDILGELVSIGTLLAFAIVCLGVLVLRYRRPDIKSVFRTPCVPLVPLLGASIALIQMAGLPSLTWVRLIIWMLIGFVVYFFYGRKKSKLRQESK